MLRKIYQDLVLIRKELQAIRNSTEPFLKIKNVRSDDVEVISRQALEHLAKRVPKSWQ